MMRIPASIRKAILPITAPAMRPDEGLLDEEVGGDDVDWEVGVVFGAGFEATVELWFLVDLVAHWMLLPPELTYG
jgi:hypothetical protein